MPNGSSASPTSTDTGSPATGGRCGSCSGSGMTGTASPGASAADVYSAGADGRRGGGATGTAARPGGLGLLARATGCTT